jgi:ribosomal protein L6P/L9E
LTQFDEEGKQFVAVAVEDDTVQNQREMWGTTRTLLSNAIEGVSVGFQQPVHLVGVGYRAVVEPNPRPAPGMSEQRLNLKLGFASQSSAFLPIPIGIDAKVPIPTRIELSGISKAAIGQFAANIRTLRKPEPYKGKVSPTLENMLIIIDVCSYFCRVYSWAERRSSSRVLRNDSLTIPRLCIL